MSLEKLFQPLQVGHSVLQHRVILAPLARVRADDHHVPAPISEEYYAQRASTPGTMLITEATLISARHGGQGNVPGIWSEAQIAAWRKIVDTIHAQGSVIWLQLWAMGRVARRDVLQNEPGGPFEVQAPSAIPGTVDGQPTDKMSVPHAMDEEEIEDAIKTYAQAARNAMSAGFDGVEVHGANGYLVDQFLQDHSNTRSDRWGGSVENRARFGVEVVKAIVEAVGDSNRVAIRLSPWSRFQAMGMQNPGPQFEYMVQQLKSLDIAYVHIIEGRASGGDEAPPPYGEKEIADLKRFIEAWGTEKPVILAGGFTPGVAKQVINERAIGKNIAIAFGRCFLATPDLPFRLRHGIEPNKWDESTFYGGGTKGYTDYPFCKEWISKKQGRITLRLNLKSTYNYLASFLPAFGRPFVSNV